MRQPSLVTDSEGLASFYSPSSPPPPAKLIAMTDPQKQSFITTPPGPQNTDGALHHALLNVRELESQNAKLYEDNRRLAAAVHMLNERHVFLSKPQVAQLQQLTYLQELVRNIEADRLFTTRQHQDLLNSLANGTAPQLLVMQLQQSRAEYTHLLGEYNYLLDKHTRLKVHLSMVSSAHTPSHVPPGAQGTPRNPSLQAIQATLISHPSSRRAEQPCSRLPASRCS
ncbi:hypothetical protein F5141DRAFT_154549 [Pisolithus sp. B1]|nr:hypothetical protein F5141DRAFT_154549 [Pisolithus sp. B1]